jgi:type I restriction enzyme S subunit
MGSERRSARLGTLVNFKTGKLDSNAAVPSGTYPFFTCSQNTLLTNTYSFDTECVLLAGNNANGIFPLKYFHGKFDAYQRTYVVTTRDPNVLMIRFLYYALRPKLSEFRSISTGAATKFLTLNILNETEIEVPSLSLQRRIVAILSPYDDLIENNQRRIRILEEVAHALYREWFVQFRFPGYEKVRRVTSPLGDIPQHWDVKCIPECVEINPRVVVARDSEKPFVPMGSLVDGSMLITDIESRVGNSGAKFQNGDTLFARITPCLENGKTGFVQFLSDSQAVAHGSTEFIVLRSRTLTPEFVYLLARSDEFRGNAIKSMSGASGRQRVQEQCFDGFQIVQPPRDLLDRFSSVVAPSFRLIQELHRQTQILRQTRDLLLPRLLSRQVNLAAG